jgi:uncharacterized protein YecE (DUF72 family)
VGTGGWSYFKVRGDKLYRYSRCFNFVEVNTTFYLHPSPNTVRHWRSRVPDSFVFSVKCHRSVSHGHRLRPTVQAIRDFEKSLDVGRLLHASVMVLQTPAILPLTGEMIHGFLRCVDTGDIRLALEARGPISTDALNALERYDVIHIVDLSKETPSYVGEILYSRLLGSGEHNIYQFDDNELREIRRKAENTPARKVFLSFHGLKMYLDAARMKSYLEMDVIPRTTSGIGLDSLREVVAEDVVFPTTRDELLSSIGWKLVELPDGRQVRAITMLTQIEDRLYRDLDDLISSLRIV